ncbi:MAG TPA: PDZ domain-containing protein [Puia sp.]|nr:PDZ domain-containing protein [Puia sp.]
MHKWPCILCLVILPLFCHAQNPLSNLADGTQSRFSNKQPVIDYTLTIDSSDLSVISVQIKLTNISDTFQLAMYTHPLADDKYWRYIEQLTVKNDDSKASLSRKDSALWKFVTHGHQATVNYKIHLPAFKNPHAVSKPFLTQSGGLVGGYHNFLYVVGQTLAPCYIHFQLPSSWQIATGLEPTADPFTYYASCAGGLLDAPAMIGHFSKWQFQVSGVPHTIVYWPLPNASAFDTTTLVSNIEKIVTEACKLFGRLPYREYFFLLQDDGRGALEHINSVTVGVPSKEIAKNISDYNEEIAHEYFHAWNMLRIVPVEYTNIDYRPPQFSKSLWWSEGVTMFYADLLLRRAGIPYDTTTRKQHLAELVEKYINNPGNHSFSAEKASMSDVAPPGFLGDYFASTHLQGELIGNLLDIIIRDATNGKQNIDDLMRNMFEHFSSAKGFNGNDVEKMANNICHCDVHSFFEDHIRGNKMIDFNKYFLMLGLKMSNTKKLILDDDKKPAADKSVFVWNDAAMQTIKLWVTDPQSCWGKAGLHTGDVLLKINDAAVTGTSVFYSSLDKLKPGDTVIIEIKRNEKIIRAEVYLTSVYETWVSIERLPSLSAKQEKLYVEWINGK